jgi:chromosome segregation ATPase
MLTSARAYDETYYLNRKKILQDFLKDEENETMKYIDDTENLVSSTKMILKGVVTGDLDYSQIKEKLQEIDNELSNDCDNLNKELKKLEENDKEIEKNTLELQKQEIKGTDNYLQRIEQLKNELENKEFTIQNMERLYVELENIIKDNLAKGNEQLLSLEQFDNFVQQNDRIKKECELLEEQKNELLKEYNCLLKENLNLKSKDESFEIEKIKDVLEEISTMGNLHKEAESRIGKLQERYTQLTKECNDLTEQIKSITKTLEGLNIDNPRLNKELAIINNELYPYEKRLNRSFTQMYENNDWKDIEDYYLIKKKKNNNINKKKKHKVTKTSLI